MIQHAYGRSSGALICAALLLAAPAASAQFLPPLGGGVTLTFAADAGGWSLGGTYTGGPYVVAVTVTLTQDAAAPMGSVVTTLNQEVPLAADPGGVGTLSVPAGTGGGWGMTLAPGTYYAAMQAIVFAGTSVLGGIPIAFQNEVAGPFTVPEPPPAPAPTVPGMDPQGPGYWKNHPEAWTLTSVTLGGVVYDASQAMDLLCEPVRGDATIALAKQLIAAKLNMDAGTDAAGQDMVDAADAYLEAVPLGSKPKGAAQAEGLFHKEALELYNLGVE